MHSAINIREIVRNSIECGGGNGGGSSPLCSYGGVSDFTSSSSCSGGGNAGNHPEGHMNPGGGPADKGVLLPSSGKGKRKRNPHEDPMSHRIIEKRRRDRMNNCLADLSRLIPSSYSKKERGRIEKTEIIEMAIRHLKNLQTHCTCGIFESPEIDHSETSSTAYNEEPSKTTLDSKVSYFKVGYDECTAEVVNFLVESEGFYVGDSLCVRLTRHLGHSFSVKYKGGGNQAHKRPSRLPAAHVSMTSSSSSDTGSYSRGNNKHGEVSSEQHHYMHNYMTEGDKYLKGGGHPPLPESGFSSANSSSQLRGSWSQHLKSSQYKFKSNLHERFSHQKPYDLSEPGMKYYRKSEQISPLDYSPFSWTPLHHRSGEESLFRPYSHVETPESSNKLDASSHSRSNVPIFALHPKEGYYMALSVDSALIDPYLILFTQIDKVSLHPITISVNFCGPMALAFGSYNNNTSASATPNATYTIPHNAPPPDQSSAGGLLKKDNQESGRKEK